MDPTEASRVLGVARDTPWPEVRRAYLASIRVHHPDRTGDAGSVAIKIIEAYRVLDRARTTPAPSQPSSSAPPPPRPPPPPDWSAHDGEGTEVARLDGDTIALRAPADETLRWLLDAAHDIGEITYLDRSVPIFEVLCRFVGEPATSLVVTLQGRSEGTEVFCTSESIEARPGPPTSAVVDVFEHAIRAKTLDQWSS